MNAETFENSTVILLDIAGTVGSLNFVKDVLFEYAKKNVEEYLKANWEKEDIQEAVKKLSTDEKPENVADAVKIFEKLTEESSSNEGFKSLQGLVYEEGYKSDKLKAHLFDDVKDALTNWSKTHKICLYSTGSESAQRMYFAHSTAGDLSSHISKYFDQSVGSKVEEESYTKIAKDLEVAPEKIVFLCDNIDEIKAAKKAGLLVVLIEREGNAAVADEDKKDLLVASSFDTIPLTQKRKNSEDEETPEEPPAKVAKTETAEETSAPPAEEEKMEVDAVAAEKTEENVPVVEDKVPEESSASEEKTNGAEIETPVNEKTDVSVAEEATEKAEVEVAVEAKEETSKPEGEEAEKAENKEEVKETKADETEAKSEAVAEVEKTENGVEEAPKEAADSEEDKENKQNGKVEENIIEAETNGEKAEAAEEEINGEGKKVTDSASEADIKVKKIEEPAAVSVEV